MKADTVVAAACLPPPVNGVGRLSSRAARGLTKLKTLFFHRSSSQGLCLRYVCLRESLYGCRNWLLLLLLLRLQNFASPESNEPSDLQRPRSVSYGQSVPALGIARDPQRNLGGEVAQSFCSALNCRPCQTTRTSTFVSGPEPKRVYHWGTQLQQQNPKNPIRIFCSRSQVPPQVSTRSLSFSIAAG